MKRGWPQFGACCLIFGLWFAAGLAWSQQDESRARQADLDLVKQRIQTLERSLAELEASRSAAEKARAQAERAVSAARRKVRELAQQRAEVEHEMTALVTQQQALQRDVEARQNELAQWLRASYMQGRSEVAPLLSARDPNQLARDLRYLERLGQARRELIEGLRRDLEKQLQLVDLLALRKTEIDQLEHAQRQQLDQLAAVVTERSRVLAGLNQKSEQQRNEIDGLRQDEAELAAVMLAIARRQAEREAARKAAEAAAAAAQVERQQREAAQRLAELRALAEREAQMAGLGGAPEQGSPQFAPSLVVQRRVIREDVPADPALADASFSQLRGKMRVPVEGSLVGRFGAPRAEGGTRWRGVFIRAQDGQEVQAVAAGEVVFADWMRGYGNLIIIDHGGEFLSIYGHNDALFARVGERVRGGTAIAAVGSSGSMQESGLYFEIRHKGEPVDPMRWVRAN